MGARATERVGIAALLSPSLPAFAVPEEGRGLALLSNFGPGVLTDFGPPAVPQPTVSRFYRGLGMDRKAKVDLFEQLRREHEFGVGTVAGVAAKFGVHRRMVRQALASALPPARHYPQRAKPKLDAVASFIDRVLEEDLRAPRKQRHTARRAYRRLLTGVPRAPRGGCHTAHH